MKTQLLIGAICGVLCAHADTNITASVTLSENADWRGQGTVTIAKGVTLDLAGHQLKLSGLAGSGTITDSTPLGDSELVSNGSFEAYEGTLLNGTWNQCSAAGAAQPTGWTFQTSDPSAGPGLGMSGSPWVGTAPDGTMVAYIQKDGLLTQTINVPADGCYVLSFKYAARPYASKPTRFFGLRIYAEVDGAAIRYVKTASTASSTVVVGIPLTAGEHTLALRGDSIEGSDDHCTWFDAVSLKPLSAACGELVIDVPEDAELVNSTVALTGNMKITKSGAGVYTAAKDGQTYVGGTVVEAGTLKAGYLDSGTSSDAYGWGSTIKVCSGATFDIDGWANVSDLLWLDGGTVKNGTDRGNAWTTWIKNMILTADSTVEADESFTFFRAAVRNSVLTLGAFTLTMQIPKDRFFTLANLEVRGNGLLLAEGGGCLHIGGGDGLSAGTGYYLRAREATLQVENASIKGTGAELEVGNYIANHAGSGDDTAAALKVFGRFQPKTRWHNCELQDGATLDLSAVPGTWATICLFSDGVTGTASFASDAAISLHLGDREVTVGDQLVEWRGQRPDSATFTFDEAAAARGVTLVELTLAEFGRSGLFYGEAQDSEAVIVAHWTGGGESANLTDPGNWACTNMAGRAVENGLPSDSTSVHIAGDVALQVPSDTALPHYELVFGNITLKGDCDWCGLGEDAHFDQTIDLKGHKLFVSALKGTGKITDTTPLGEDLIRDGSFEGVVITGDWGYFDGTGSSVASDVWRSDKPAKTGFTKVGTTWVNPLPLEGTQAAYIQAQGELHQAVTVPEGGGSYVLTYSHAWRPYKHTSNGVEIRVDDEPYCGISYSGESFVTHTVVLHLAEGEHTVKFAGTVANDNATAVIEGVSLRKIPAAGELHVVVPDGETTEWTSVTIDGTLKFVKEGKGTYLASNLKGGVKTWYLGDTWVREGCYKVHQSRVASGSGNDDYSFYQVQQLGAQGSETTVEKDATFDYGGNYDGYCYTIVLNGGTYGNLGTLNSTKNCGTPLNVRLTDDSLVRMDSDGQLGRTDLGGHTLTITNSPARSCYLRGAVKNGTLVSNGGTFHPYDADMTDVDLVLNGKMSCADQTVTFRNLTVTYTGDGFGNGANFYCVSGTYTPISDQIHRFKLLDGATIDLSKRTTSLDIEPDANGLFFDDNVKTIYVSVAGRKLRSSEPLLTWTAKPNVKFVATKDSNCGLVAKDLGLYPLKGMLIIVR